ncbi:MAG: methionine--tRNA ligase [Phycisphaeraceae bacterium]|nr:methionine--tRNA ligase [Phycisphaeraceae bacterium]
MADDRRYLTTPIYYVNDRPHIGHVYTTLLADVLARAHRQRGRDVFFLTGTDEHGLKVEQSARARGIPPKALADENSRAFRDVMSFMEMTNDDFIRTTDPDHERQVGVLLQRLLDSGDIYLGEFEGWYDEGQEEYYTETKAAEVEYRSPVSGKPLVRAREKNYYFRLSAYQARLEAMLGEQPGFVRPEARRNEVSGRLREGLQDVPISRTNFTWGVPMPGDPEHVVYVWIDALFNYITALGLAEPQSDRFRARGAYWPATCHLMGKEILWFHAVIWPALLMALGLPLPQCVYAHSFWIREGQKMSKSLGNFLDLPTIERYVSHYGLDAWRWYLVTQGPLGATDANFADSHFHDVYTTDLVNTVGNCASRVSAMIGKYFDGALPIAGADVQHGADWPESWPRLCDDAVQAAEEALARQDLVRFADAGIGLLRRVDAFINRTEPFKVAKDPARRDELAAILVTCAEAVRVAGTLLHPILPGRMEELLAAFGGAGAPAAPFAWGRLSAGTSVTKVALYPRAERLTAGADV